MSIRRLLIPLFFLLHVAGFAQTARSLYDEGLKFKTEKNIAEAIKKFQQALLLNPAYTESRYELAWCQNDTRDYQNALNNLKQVRQAWPSVPKVYFELGYAFDRVGGQTDSAIAAYYKCLSLKADYAGAYKQLAYIEYTRDNHNAAVNHFKNCIQLSKDEITDYLFWYRKGFTENALREYENAIASLLKSENLKKDYFNTYLELGFACKNLKRNEEAIAYYNKAIALDPQSHIPYNGIGEVYRDNVKDMAKAMDWYKKTLAINPKERKGNFGMGYCLNSTQRFNEAIPYLKTAIENEKDYIAAHTELGYSYYKTGNFTEALVNLNKSISLNPNGANPYYYATLVYLEQKNKTKAQEMVNALKRIGSKYGDELQKRVDAL
jgi:tetratricopeptide (TPR) repeat protein